MTWSALPVTQPSYRPGPSNSSRRAAHANPVCPWVWKSPSSSPWGRPGSTAAKLRASIPPAEPSVAPRGSRTENGLVRAGRHGWG
jgi:hypothetical protein